MVENGAMLECWGSSRKRIGTEMILESFGLGIADGTFGPYFVPSCPECNCAD